MHKITTSHWPAILIATAFFILAATYSVINPIFEALDEVWHYPFVWHLARTWELPVQDPANVQLWRQEASQPPFYYALTALLTAPIPTDDLPDLIYRNPHADLGIVTADGNINMIVHTAKEAWPWTNSVLAVHVARLVSVVISTGTVITIYLLGKLLWPDRPSFALLAMAFVAFNPMFLFVSASVNNDNLVTLLASLVIWRLVIIVLRLKEPPLWQFALLGVLIGLAALSKLSGLGLLGLVGLTLLWLGWSRRWWRTAIGGNGIIVILTGLTAGWWYWRNIVLYSEWSGTQNMVQMMGPRTVTLTAGQLLAEVPGLMRSFWGLFGGLSLAMPSAVYWILNLILVAGLLGIPIAALLQKKSLPQNLARVWPILTGWILLTIIALIQWTLRTPASQGRLLFPTLAAVATLWAAGWMLLTPRRLHPLPAVLLFVLAVWVPWGIIAPAYARPESIATVPTSAQPINVTFDDAITLVAAEGNTSTQVRPGQSVPITLYWRSQHSVETDYSIFIQLLDAQDLVIAQRDTYPGLGLYPTSQWQPGEQFADTYILQIPRAAFAPSTAQFGVGLYDRTTGTRLPASTGGDMVRFGEVIIQPQPGDIPNPQDLRFEDSIALVGYTIDRQLVASGDTVKLTLYWESRGQPSQNYKIFVHLVAEGDVRAAQNDSEPQNGAAPTSRWQPEQIIIDEHSLTINPEAQPGAYRLKVGLYDGATGRRLRLIENDGISVQADSVLLSGVRVVK